MATRSGSAAGGHRECENWVKCVYGGRERLLDLQMPELRNLGLLRKEAMQILHFTNSIAINEDEDSDEFLNDNDDDMDDFFRDAQHPLSADDVLEDGAWSVRATTSAATTGSTRTSTARA